MKERAAISAGRPIQWWCLWGKWTQPGHSEPTFANLYCPQGPFKVHSAPILNDHTPFTSTDFCWEELVN